MDHHHTSPDHEIGEGGRYQIGQAARRKLGVEELLRLSIERPQQSKDGSRAQLGSENT